MLLLDEMLPDGIARQLTDAGCDTSAVCARPDLQGAADVDVLEHAAREGRILVTANVRDFVPLARMWERQGRTHPGMLFISTSTFPMVRGRSGSIARALLVRCRSRDWPQPGQYDFLRA